MQSLLRWSIENANGEDGAQQRPPQPPRKDLDPGVIDMILGKPDSELMKENLAVALDEKRDEDERLEALDNFEMLIEHIDNANDLVKLKMWEPLQGLLTSSSSSDAIKRQVLWIVGTAVQNNPAAQNAYLELDPMQTLVSFLAPNVGTSKTRSKAVYALSGLTKHCAPALRQLRDADGWDALKVALSDSDITVRRKVAFLLNALLVPSASTPPPPPPSAAAAAPGATSTAATLHPADSAPNAPVHPNSHASMLADPANASTSALAREALERRGLLDALVGALAHPLPHGPDGEQFGDADFEEKVVGALNTYVVSCDGQLSPEQKQTLSAYVQEQTQKAGGEAALAERWGLTADELRRFKQALA